MNTRIIPIDLGFGTCYLLQSDGLIVIDAGQPKKGAAFQKALDQVSVNSADVSLILLTHAHWDHMGSASELRAITGAPLAVHEAEASWVELGNPPLPPGVTPWGRTFMAAHKLLMPLIHVPPAHVDRRLGDDPLRLDEFGIPGVVIHTPGHSPGSVSVVLDSGEAFVGDLAMNRMPVCSSPSLPIFADDPVEVRRSWNRLLELPIEKVYPAHGSPFGVEVVRELLDT